MRGILKKDHLVATSKLVKFLILFACGLFTIFQVAECVNKLISPPISTRYYCRLNETIKYPCITICRRPAFKYDKFYNYNVRRFIDLDSHNAFKHFNFENHTVSEFIADTTYNFTDIVKQYGYAGVGQNPNLSVSSFYDIIRGQCSTLKPMIQSNKFSVSGGYFFYLNHNMKTEHLDENGISMAGFQIYLHDPNEILTYDDEQLNSFLEFIYLEASEDIQVVLEVKEYRRIPSRDNECIHDPNYSKSKCQEDCVSQKVAAKANCTLPWLYLPDNVRHAECNNYESVKDLIIDFRNSRDEYLAECNCPMACNFTIYKTSIIRRKAMDEQNAPNSIIYIYYSSNLVTIMSEVLGYDWNQLLADIGGSLGFLLGLSVIGLIYLVEELAGIAFKWMFSRRARNEEEQQRCEEQREVAQNDGQTKDAEKNKNKAKHDDKTISSYLTNLSFYDKSLTRRFHNESNENERY